MFRSALVRAARRAAALPAARGLSSMSMASSSRPSLAAGAAGAKKQGVAWGKVLAVRGYASGGGLTKEDAEGRIMSLLAGFDKVSGVLCSWCWWWGGGGLRVGGRRVAR